MLFVNPKKRSAEQELSRPPRQHELTSVLELSSDDQRSGSYYCHTSPKFFDGVGHMRSNRLRTR